MGVENCQPVACVIEGAGAGAGLVKRDGSARHIGVVVEQGGMAGVAESVAVHQAVMDGHRLAYEIVCRACC